jgi:methylmalonyl-CoA/ethylmalonyl-CoA epimerase
MPLDGIACVSVAVPSIAEALPAYTEGLGLELIGEHDSKRFDLRWAELGRDGKVFIELLEPTSESSQIRRFLDRRGPGVYQVRFHVDDLDDTLAGLEAGGMRVVRGADVPGEPRLGFVHPGSTHGVLFELLEKAE